MLLLTPLVGYASVRLLARTLAGERPRVPAALAVGLVALVNGAVFATFTPAFQTPDEPDHAAYVQILGETGHRPSGDAGPRRVLAGRGRRARRRPRVLDRRAVRRAAAVAARRDLDRWRATASQAARPRRGRRRDAPPRRTGPGTTSLAAPAYLAARDSGFFASLWAMRLVSALLGAITAACTVLFIRELAPRVVAPAPRCSAGCSSPACRSSRSCPARSTTTRGSRRSRRSRCG